MNSSAVGARYRIEQTPIGKGGMGVVYRAFDNVTKRFVALKTLRGPVDQASLELFQKEWRVLAGLCHANIVDVLDIGELVENDQPKPYFVMPLLPGATLDKLIETSGQRLTPERIVEIIRQTCRGLQAAHDKGLIHRDLKPSNLLVMDDDTVKIIDFGVVHLTGAESKAGIKGTLQYMAPEQLEMKPATVQTDIFSLGVVCYEALTGRKPFDGNTSDEIIKAIQRHTPPPVSELNPGINEQVSRAVHKAIAKQPYHRFASAREFSDVLLRSMRNEYIELFDSAKIQPRIRRIKKALGESDYQFALEILTELESEGNIDPEMSVLRIQAERAMRARTIHQLLESARIRMEEEEYPLALQKIQSALDLDASNIDALALKGEIERKRRQNQIDKWYQLSRQHFDNKLYSKSRQAVEEILKIDSGHHPAREMLAEISLAEQELAKFRQEKQHNYELALKAYRNGEISSALTKLERVIALIRSTPGHPSTDAQYLAFYEEIRSERDELQKAYSEGKKALESHNFGRALEICKEVLSRRPGEPLFQSLKLEVEDLQRQQHSAAIANLHSRVEAEPDLERKLAILRDAVKQFPREPAFVQLLKLVKERRDLVNSIVGRARHYESQGQFAEAAGQWDVLRNIYAQYPGLEYELRRLNRKQQEYARDEANATWLGKIDRALDSGDYKSAADLLKSALLEAPEDSELLQLKEQVEQAVQRIERAQDLFRAGQELAEARDYPAAIEKLRAARELDSKAQPIRAALGNALVEQARALARSDWRSAVPLVEEALDLNPNEPGAADVSGLIEEARRRESVERYLSDARDLHKNGRSKDALEKVEGGLREFPNEIRLSRLQTTLRISLENQASEAPKEIRPAYMQRAAAAAAGDYSSAPLSTPETVGSDAKSLTGPDARTATADEKSTSSSGNFEPYRQNSSFGSDSSGVYSENLDESLSPVLVSGGIPVPLRRGSRGEIPLWWKLGTVALVLALLIAAAAILHRRGEPAGDVRVHRGGPTTATEANSQAASGAPSALSNPEARKDDSQAAQASPSSSRAGRTVPFHFSSNPVSARVMVDNDEDLICHTPCDLPLSIGRHTLLISAPKYAEMRRIVQVPNDNSWYVSLADGLETVHINSVPPNLNLIVDGEEKGQTPKTLRLGVGKHQLTVTKDNLQSEQTIEVVRNDFNVFTLTLDKDKHLQ